MSKTLDKRRQDLELEKRKLDLEERKLRDKKGSDNRNIIIGIIVGLPIFVLLVAGVIVMIWGLTHG